MGQLPDLPEARRRLELALDSIRRDRWVLGFLRGGEMQPLITSELSRRFLQSQPLMPLARRALFERRPLVVNAVVDAHDETANDYDWELDWPALLYTPVAEIGERPVGLLILGCRTDHWYTEANVAYMHTLGVSLAPMVSALRRPFSKLNPTESMVAQLLSHGFSPQEIARAMNAEEPRARSLVERVRRMTW
jgi:GAF domain